MDVFGLDAASSGNGHEKRCDRIILNTSAANLGRSLKDSIKEFYNFQVNYEKNKCIA